MPPKYGAAEDDLPESGDERPPSPPGLPGASTATPSRVTFDPMTSGASPSAAELEERDRHAPRLGASYGATSAKYAPPAHPSTSKDAPKDAPRMSAARALWQRALRKVKVHNRMRRVVIEGDVTPYAAAAANASATTTQTALAPAPATASHLRISVFRSAPWQCVQYLVCISQVSNSLLWSRSTGGS